MTDLSNETISPRKPVFSFSLSRDQLSSSLSIQVKKRVSEIRLKVQKNITKLESIDLKSEQAELFKENLQEKLERLRQSQTIHKALQENEDLSKNTALEVHQKLSLEVKMTDERLNESNLLIKKVRDKFKQAKKEFDEFRFIFNELTQKESEICISISQLKLERLRLIKEQNALYRIQSEEEVKDLESRFAVKPDKKPALVIEVNLNESSNRNLLIFFVIFIWLIVLAKYLNINK